MSQHRRRTWALVAAGSCCWLTTLCAAQETDPAQTVRPSHPAIIDKVKIAERAHDRIVGAREVDNPHVPVGSKLKDAVFAEPRDDGYQQELRDRTLALYGERGTLNWIDSTVGTEASKPAARVATPLQPAMASSWQTAGVVAAVVAALASAIELSRRAIARDRAARSVS